MSANLTDTLPKDTYHQLLHLDGGVEAAEKTVRGGTGTATALKVGIDSASVDNLKFDGNTISSTNTDGNIVLDPNGSGAVVIDNATITAGTITGITDLAVADGGTGGSTAAAARSNLGLGSISTQDASTVAITGGTITGASLVGSFTGVTLISSATFTASSAIGFGAGGGGTVTQATSKSTGVTLNKPSGQITMNNAALNAGIAVSFTLTNSSIATTDVVVVSIDSGATAASYEALVDAVGAGSCLVTLRNYTGGNLSEAVVLNFVVIKASTS